MSHVASIGILGLGPAGQAMAAQLAQDARFRLAAVCDLRAEALAHHRGEDVAAVTSLTALCALPGLDAVIVATPTPLHAEQAIALLRAGKHVVLEKPMAVTAEEAAAMVRAAEAAGRQLMVGHSHSFEPAVRAMHVLIGAGRLGRLRAVNGWQCSDWIYRPRHAAEFDRSQGGGVVYRQAAHHIDVVRFLCGENPTTVAARVGRWDAARPGDGSYSAWLSFPSGVVSTLFYSGYDRFSSLELTFGLGEGGRPARPPHGASRRAHQGLDEAAEVTRKYGDPALSRRGDLAQPGTPQATFGLVVASCERADLRVGPGGLLVYGDDGPWLLPLEGQGSGRQAVLDELAAVCAGAPAVHDAQWGAANLEVCLAMLASSDEGRPLPLQLRHSGRARVEAAFTAEVLRRAELRAPVAPATFLS